MQAKPATHSELALQLFPIILLPYLGSTLSGSSINPKRLPTFSPPAVDVLPKKVTAKTKTTIAIIPKTIIVQTGVSPRLFILRTSVKRD